jgi:acyl-CoA synthetase (NDP forming)
MYRYANWKNNQEPDEFERKNIHPDKAKTVLDQHKGQKSLGESLTRPILESYGIPTVKGELAKTDLEAAQKASAIGFPVVMKIVSKDILHKSDVGGIRLNLTDQEQVANEFNAMMTDVKSHLPDAEIEGVLIEETAPKGIEVIIGMRRDIGFGPILMFGMGGIYVELFKDVSFRIAPISRNDALDMIAVTKAGTLLKGFRGSKEADIEAVVDVLMRLSQLVCDFSEIEEIEINPLLVMPKGEGALALDSRIIL